MLQFDIATQDTLGHLCDMWVGGSIDGPTFAFLSMHACGSTYYTACPASTNRYCGDWDMPVQEPLPLVLTESLVPVLDALLTLAIDYTANGE